MTFKKRIQDMREEWGKRRFELSLKRLINPDLQPEDVLPLIDEAKKEFPQYYIEESKDFTEGCYAKVEYDDFFDLIKWFTKWFGEAE